MRRSARGSSRQLVRADPLAAEIAEAHHEKWDGNGYPNGLAGEAIPLAARIVAVADVFDALTTARPYKEAMPFGDALDCLRLESGRHFDPACVDAFARCWPEVLAVGRAASGTRPGAVGGLTEPWNRTPQLLREIDRTRSAMVQAAE